METIANPEILVAFKTHIESGQLQEALTLLKDNDNKVCVKEYGWELTGLLCKSLDDDKEDVFQCCSTCLQYLAQTCKAKEILLGLNEQFSNIHSLQAFLFIVPLCNEVFLKIDKKQSLYLRDILDGFTTTVNALLLEEETGTQVGPFVQIYEKLAQNFSHPYLDHVTKKDEGHKLETILDSTMELIYSFTDLQDLLSPDQSFTSQINHVGFLTMIYMELTVGSSLPRIYSPSILYLRFKSLMVSLLKRTSNTTIKLALDVHEILLNMIPDLSLQESFTSIGREVSRSLSNIMIWSDTKNLRQRSKEQFDSLLGKFKWEVRYELLRSIYTESEHSSLRGYVISLIGTTFKEVKENDLPTNAIKELAVLFTSFEQGENILQESERLMAGLNFIRFWLLKDPKASNKTGIWDVLPDIVENCKHMRCGIDVSMTEYRNFLSSGTNTGIEMELTIPGGEILKSMSQSDKTRVTRSAMLSLEMMLSVLVRISEISDT